MLQLNVDGNDISHIFLEATGAGHRILCQTVRADHRIGADVRKTDYGVVGQHLNPVEW
jgi:hypothetical protein